MKLGFILELDTFWEEPWVVPYAHAGIYTTMFTEETNGSTFDGTTLPAFYFSGGLMFQLDWIDNFSAREAFQSSNIENTFIFAEVNFQADSMEDKDPSFNSIYASAGLKVEF